jgi:hypothetical protein
MCVCIARSKVIEVIDAFHNSSVQPADGLVIPMSIVRLRLAPIATVTVMPMKTVGNVRTAMSMDICGIAVDFLLKIGVQCAMFSTRLFGVMRWTNINASDAMPLANTRPKIAPIHFAHCAIRTMRPNRVRSSNPMNARIAMLLVFISLINVMHHSAFYAKIVMT